MYKGRFVPGMCFLVKWDESGVSNLTQSHDYNNMEMLIKVIENVLTVENSATIKRWFTNGGWITASFKVEERTYWHIDRLRRCIVRRIIPKEYMK